MNPITNEELAAIENPIVFDSFIKAQSVLKKHNNIAVSVSGGADSDCVVDLIERIKGDKQIHYVFFDTGVELAATKKHLTDLENKYGITIERERAIKPIPTTCKEYGQPFISKFVSEHLERMQQHGFKFEDKPYNELIEEYPHMIGSIKWWCNAHETIRRTSQFNINRNKWLKEFLIAHPPTFRISNKCCRYAKKKVGTRYAKNNNVDLSILGIRKNEGGVRALLNSCYTASGETAVYRPLFWYSTEAKEYYEQHFGIVHSECYTKYGMKRTGCVGCPLNRKVQEDISIFEIYEPDMAKACRHIFKDAYEYTRQYRDFAKEMNFKTKADPDQVTIYDL